jgi:hypothetical protein
MIATKDGEIVTSDNPLPVTLGSDTITITGSVNVGTTVEISNDEGNPIPTHTHLFDENDSEYSASNPLTVDGTVNIGSMPEVEIKNDSGNPIPVTIGGNVSLNIDSDNPLPVVGTTLNPWGKLVLTVDDDTVQHTSKNRRKVSTFDVTDFSTFTTGKDLDIWDEIVVGASSSSTHDSYLGMVKLTVGPNVGDKVYRQTKRVQRYIPGRQNEVSMTMIFGPPTTGIRRRFGLFDYLNGFFFEDSGNGTYSCKLRRNTAEGVEEDSWDRDVWNVDKLDGTGPSGITADPLKIQHMSIEYEWYGAGQVEWNFVIDNNKYPIHRVNHANREPHTWSSRASLPVRIEIENIGGTAGTHDFYQGSHSFSTEGSTEILGRQNSISTAITGRTLSSSNTFYPIVAIRLKSTALNSVVIPDEFSGATLDNTNIFIRTIELPTITGGTWISYGTESAVEYNLTATGYTGGTALSTTFVNDTGQGNTFSFPNRSLTQLLRNTTTTLGDTSGTFLIAIASTGSNKSAFASLGWIEVR